MHQPYLYILINSSGVCPLHMFYKKCPMKVQCLHWYLKGLIIKTMVYYKVTLTLGVLFVSSAPFLHNLWWLLN